MAGVKAGGGQPVCLPCLQLLNFKLHLLQVLYHRHDNKRALLQFQHKYDNMHKFIYDAGCSESPPTAMAD